MKNILKAVKQDNIATVAAIVVVAVKCVQQSEFKSHWSLFILK